MRVVIEIDGGGAKGVIPLTILKNMEKEIGKPLHEWADLVVSTSVGSIIGSSILIGDKSAEQALEEFLEDVKVIFKPRIRIPIIQPKYSMRTAKKKLAPYLGGKFLADAKSKFMFTSVDMVTGRTHFFKSWEQADGSLPALDTVARSFAAPLYFGSIVDKDNSAVWLDGGTSNNNCPLVESYVEILRQGWTGDTPAHVISLGCGKTDYSIPFNKAKNYKNIRQVSYYLNPKNGGLARVVAADTQVCWLQQLTETSENFSFQRLQYTFSGKEKKFDGMDKIRYLSEYQQIGEELSKQVDYSFIKG